MIAHAKSPEAVLRVRGIEKRYASPVLADLNLDLYPGEIHALMGANGAGKSTLSRIICGLTVPDRGTLALGGKPYRPRSRQDAQRSGVQIVTQELNLVPTLTVAENLFLTDLPRRFGFVSYATLLVKAAAALNAVGLPDLDPRTPAGELGVGKQQLVALAAALAHPCRVLVLDEPTAALTESEIAIAFDHLRRLREAGTAILYISHRLPEIERIGDRITVLRDGRVVGTCSAAGASIGELVQLMVGARAVETLERHATPATGDVALRVEALTRAKRLREVTFEVRHGEIVGLAGLVGSGRTETLRAIFGADDIDSGTVSRGSGPALSLAHPSDAVRAGIGMVPEDRKEQALLLDQSVRMNMTLAALSNFVRRRWWIDDVRELDSADGLRARLDIRVHSLDQRTGELSGGNQQKVVIARWLLRNCDVLLFDEPTRGIDVGAKIAVYRVLTDLAAQGKAIVVSSAELPELMALCDRIAVLSAGRLVATFVRGAWSEEAILSAAFSGYAARGDPRPPSHSRPC
jgi:ribose transport system ATP-binding protein